MNPTRRILERIHEVELQITPEFQKPERDEPEDEGWDAPDQITYSAEPRIDYLWTFKDNATVRGVSAKAHGNAYAISWIGSSKSLDGHWGEAIAAIKEAGGGDRIYVYGVSPLAMDEFTKLMQAGIVSAAFDTSLDVDPAYDANIDDMLKEYIGGHQKSGGVA
ncbi:MAG: hypothetical protein KAJ19_09550 [Gammaproteobacteria bacterium]|nr:hypothetical protein [Gammaproteobacteria bacterium]